MTMEPWRQAIQQIVMLEGGRISEEGKRISRDIQIAQSTLLRWATGPSKPNRLNLSQFVKACAYQDQQIILPIFQAAGLLSNEEEVVIGNNGIGEESLLAIITAAAVTSPSMRTWAISELCLRQMFNHLDQNREGLFISLLLCTPPSPPSSVVRSLHEEIHIQSGSRSGVVSQTSRFLLGYESLAGAACSSNQILFEAQAAQSHFQQWLTFEPRSMAAVPLLHAGLIGGCLLFISPNDLTHYTDLLRHYSYMISLAFPPTSFFEQEKFDLLIFPVPSTLHSEVISTKQRKVAYLASTVSKQEAEARAWHAIEEEIRNKISQ